MKTRRDKDFVYQPAASHNSDAFRKRQRARLKEAQKLQKGPHEVLQFPLKDSRAKA
jgi:hypothetical protein